MLKPHDVYDDANFQALYAIDKLVGLPNFVKSAAVTDHDEIKALPTEVFGDGSRRKFPCHTKQATYLSNAYFQQSRASYPTKEAELVQGRIDNYAKYWQISSLVNNFNKSWSKVAAFNVDDGQLPDEDFAIVAEFEGNKIRRFPMPNVLGIKMAAEALYANRFMYPYPWRKEAARRILAKAEAADRRALEKQAFTMNNPALRMNNETHEYLQRATGLGVVHPVVAAEKVAQRWLMLKDTRHVGYAEKLAEMVQDLNSMDPNIVTPSILQKYASIIDVIDQETGLSAHYADGVEMPEEMFFDMLQKEAEAILEELVTLQTGNTYPRGLFTQLPLQKIAAVMGEDFKEAVTGLDGQIDAMQFADVAATLPVIDAVLMERAIKCACEEAAGIKKASRDPKLMTYGTRAGIKKEMESRGAEEHEDEGDFSFTYKLKNYQTKNHN